MRKGKLAINQLLALLQSGELRTGFHFPGRIVPWISIPPSYWARVGSDKFRSLRYSSDDEEKPGTFKVKIVEFAEEYAQAVQKKLEGDKQNQAAIVDELKVALSAASGRYEVLIPESVWTEYLTRNSLRDESPPEIEPKVGRRKLKGWRGLSVIVVAYIIKHYETSKERIKLEHSSKTIHEIAKKREISELPAAPTIKEFLSEILKAADEISIN